MTTSEMRSETLSILEEFRAKALDAGFKCPEIDSITLTFDLRGKTCGQANYITKAIRMNPEMYTKGLSHYRHTIGHELAHLISVDEYGIHRGSGHSKYWKHVMCKLGLPPERLHHGIKLTPARKTRKFLYECIDCGKEYMISTVRHNRMQRGSQNYYHAGCRGLSGTGNLAFIREVTNEI